jgi:hypothetical protein
MKLSEYREEVLRKFVKRYGYGHIEFRDFLSQSLSDLADKIVEEVGGMRKEVCGCDEDPDPMAPGYHTKNCDMTPYGFNEAIDKVLSILKGESEEK